MGLLTPLGLLGLIGIPILIIIYIIKPRYSKKSISSTFVWKLSLKYRKKRIPFQWLQKSLLLFIQILIVSLCALLLARPSILTASKDGEKVIILDVSGSMNAIDNNKTRLDRAIEEIDMLSNSINEDNKLTIIVADSEPYYLVRREASSNIVRYALNTITPTYEECNFDEALLLANTVIDENPSTEVFYYTDCQYENEGYVKVKDFSKNEWNVGILDFNVELDKGYYKFNIKIGNYNKDANIKLVLELNDSKEKYEKSISLLKDKELDIVWDDLNVTTYKNAKLSIYDESNKIVNDSLIEDNEYYLNNLEDIMFDVQLVGYSKTFMSAALKSVSNVNIFAPENEQEIVSEGKDLYIYDGYLPDSLPNDGAIWIINPPKNINQLDLKFGNKVEGEYELDTTLSESNAYKQIMNYIIPSDIKVTQYIEVSNYTNYEVLMTCNDSPVLLTGNFNRAKICVLALDLSYTTLPISLNMVVLVNNMFNYCVNHTFNKDVFSVGEEITLYAKPLTKKLYVNNSLEMDELNYEDNITITLDKPGIYEVKQVFETSEAIDKFFVKLSNNESNYRFTKEVLAVDKYINVELGVEGTPGGTFDYREISTYFACALLLLVIVEWGVQYREQY